MSHIVYIVTNHLTLRFLRGQLQSVAQFGLNVSIISSPGETVKELDSLSVQHIPIEMAREISIFDDLRSLGALLKTISSLRPQIVNASTPKAGLLGMIAAWLLRIPVRVYLVRGLRFETTTGFKRHILVMTERIASGCANYVVCNSASLQDVYIKHKLAHPKKLTTVGYGSSNGVDPHRFSASLQCTQEAKQLHKSLGIPSGATVIGFIGRLVKDKGIIELIDAFEMIQKTKADSYLLLVGPFENGDPLPKKTVNKIKTHQKIIAIDFTENVAPYYHIMDILAFPSHREGFPNVPLEAAIAGVPTVGFDATGVVDAVIDGETGLLVPVGSTKKLADTILLLIQDSSMRKRLGEAARNRALRDFNPEMLWTKWAEFYQKCIKEQLK